MFLKIDTSSPTPVYQQIISQIKYAIATGALQPGDRLPTVRDVAAENRINRNTVARAYSDLEREGAIVGRAGVGSFVADNPPAVRSRTARLMVSSEFDKTLAKAYHLRLSRPEIEDVFHERLDMINLPERKSKE